MLAPPMYLGQAFADPQYIESLIDLGAPYKTINAVHKNPPNEETPGWFRNFWALGGKVLLAGAEEAFNNPIFIEAAKTSFQAEIIHPLTMMTNLNVPAAASPPHLDLPFFRGAHEREVPNWLLAPMGYSCLFQKWAIPVASAISWFYSGEGGDFEYWPDGLDAPSCSATAPYYNTSVVADNEYMYHRVGQMGMAQDYLSKGISSDALLHRDDLVHRNDQGWDIRLNNQSIRRYSRDQIRVSILWKAFCFKDQAAADLYADSHYNLTPQMVVDIFYQDLRGRGHNVREPSDLETDEDWRKLIVDTYGADDFLRT